MASGPVISIPIDDSAIKALEARVQAARTNVAAANREVRELAKTGQQVGKELSERLSANRKDLELAQGLLKDTRIARRANDRAPFEAVTEARMAERLGIRFQRVFGGSFAQKLLTGGKLEATDLLRETVGLERLGQRVLTAVGVKNATAMAAGATIPFIGLIVEKLLEEYNAQTEKIKKSKKIGQEYGQGLMTDEELDFFQERNNQYFKTNAAEELDKLRKASDAIDSLKAGDIDKILKKAQPDLAPLRELREDFKRRGHKFAPGEEAGYNFDLLLPDGEGFRKMLDKAYQNESQRLGGPLTEATRKMIRTGVLHEALKGLGEARENEVVQQLLDAEEQAALVSKHKQGQEYIAFYDRRKKEMYETSIKIQDRRYPPNPMD